MKRKYIIYSHTTPSGKVYIGQTCQENPNRRWANGKGYKGCKLFYNSIKKYGWANIEHQILHTGLSKEKADILEKMYIQFFKRKNISLNITDGGEGHTGPLSAEHRQKISEGHQGKVLTSEHRQKLSETNKGKVLSEETKQKISESLKGRPGVSPSVETRKKISEAQKGKPRGPLSSEHRRKISEANKGKIISTETKKKISKSHKGKPNKRSIWLNEFNEEVEIPNNIVSRYHPNWIKVRSL